MTRRRLIVTALLALGASSSALATPSATPATPPASTAPITIGYISDLSGPFADNDGPGSLEAIRMAVEDVQGKVLGRPIEVLAADHQNKADLASSKTREWADSRNMKLLIGGANSAAALASNQLAGEKKFVYINIAAGTPLLTNEQCTPFTVHYAYDTVSIARVMGAAINQGGGKSWYFLTADYAFGRSLEKDATEVVLRSGGKVLGAARHPISTADFSSFLVTAQTSKAQVLALANSGDDTLNAIKTAREFGVTPGMQLAGLLMFVNNIDALGLKDAQGLLLSESWYWDRDEASRKFGERFFARTKRMPNSLHAASYSAASNYLKTVAASGTDDPATVMAALKKTPIDDFYAKGQIRADGRFEHDMYLLQVKKPEESTRRWDYLKVIATIPGNEAYNTLAESACPLVKK